MAGNALYTTVISHASALSKDVLELDAKLRHAYSGVPAWMSAAATPQMFTDTPWLYFSAHKLFWRFCNLRIIMARRAFLERALKRLPLSTRGTPPGNEPPADYILSDVCLSCATDSIDDINRFFKDRIPNALEKWYGL
jgi:transcriptional regulatory protein GAL4